MSAILTIMPSDDDDLDPYGYMKEEGAVIIEITGRGSSYRYEINEYGLEGQAGWIQESVGIEYWAEEYLGGDDLAPGWYVIEDVSVSFTRGDGWVTDDDEDWELGHVRPATQEEIDTVSVIKTADSEQVTKP